MNALTERKQQLPETIKEKVLYVLFGQDKLNQYRAQLSALSKAGITGEQYQQLQMEAQETAENLLTYGVDVGNYMANLKKGSGGDHGNQYTGGKMRNEVEFATPSKADAIEEMGFTRKQADGLQKIARHPEAVQKAISEARENNEIVTKQDVLKVIKAEEKAKEIEEAKKHIASQIAEDDTVPYLTVGNGIGYEPNEQYDLLLTDPPYSTDVDDIEAFADTWLYHALNGVKQTGFAYVFIGAYPDEIRAYLNASTPGHMQLVQPLIWTYKNTLGNNPKERYKLNYQMCLFYRGIFAPPLDCPMTSEQWAVQEINAPDGRLGDRYHAWQKPMEIAERFIRHSTKQGDTIFDPFACTGTFLLAAAKLGRKAYGFEINRENAEIAFSRGVHELAK